MTENPTELPSGDVEPETPPQSPLSEETPPPIKVKASEIKKPSAIKRARYNLFSRETRAGRFLRAFARTLALIVILLALGAGAVYVLLYQPAEQDLQAARQYATQAAATVDQSRSEMTQAQQSLRAVQTQAAQAQDQLAAGQAREQVLRAANAVLAARLALAQNNKTGAASAIKDAQTGLQTIQSQLDQLDSKEYATLQALFTLINTDLDRDAKLAAQDMDRLQSELTRVDKLLAAQ